MRFFLCFLAAVVPVAAQQLAQLDLQDSRAESVTYRARRAIHLVPAGNSGSGIAVVKSSSFLDGTIEADVAGAPGAGADSAARGFIGLAFRLHDGAHFELFYIRPTNGRANDQLRRNHSTQYESVPDWPWDRLRKESPGVYESYADLETGAWTKLKIVVSGTTAQLYVNGAAQPALLVNDLKLAPAKGAIGLWVGPGTDGYFANLKVTPR